jgi:ParB family chromosome partitioning protein
MSNTDIANKPGVFAGTGNALAAGLGSLFNEEAEFAFINLASIYVKPTQVREIFEDAENTIEELAADIKKRGVLQPILVRESEGHGHFEYELIDGERRYRASGLAGRTNIPAFIRKMTDEQAEDAQFVANIHRLNLTQIETAKRIQRDLDAAGGDVQVVLAKYSKNHSWLSKMLSLLSLSEQAQRLISENISADVEVINSVKQIEKVNPEAAKTLVNDLAATRGKSSARAQANEVKDKVKPSKKKQEAAKVNASSPAKTAAIESNHTPAACAAGSGLTAEQLVDLMKKAYPKLAQGSTTQFAVPNPKHRASLSIALKWFYEMGQSPHDAGRALITGFSQGIFANGDYREFQLSAYAYGLKGTKYALETVLESVK